MTMLQTILCWSLIGVPALLVLAVFAQALRRHLMRGHPRCANCLYDLTGNQSSRCPECGQDLQSPRSLLRHRPLLEQMAMVAILIGCSLYGWPVMNRVADLREGWETALMPTTVLLGILPWSGADRHAIVEDRLFEKEQYTSGWSWQREWLIRRCGTLAAGADDALAMHAVQSLCKIAPLHHSALTRICKALTSEHDARRRDVAKYLGNLYGDLPRLSDRGFIAGALSDAIEQESDTWALLVEIDALEQMGPAAVEIAAESLRKAMRNPDKAVQAIAFEAFSMIGNGHFQYLTDDELAQVLNCLSSDISHTENHTTHFYGRQSQRYNRSTWDLYLIEMIRRGGPVLEQCLEAQLQSQEALLESSDSPLDIYQWWYEFSQLEILTALRRLQHRPRPLTVEARLDGDALFIRLRNTDEEHKILLVQQGGDNDGPRMERFHVEVRDADGTLMATQFQTNNFGGISSLLPLAFGESLGYELKLSDYAHMPTQPGAYTITVHYHDVLQIAAEPDVSRYITSCSEPIEVTIR